MNEPVKASERQVCAFTLGDQLFGIDIRYIQEVLRFQQCTPVPRTPPLVTGLLNLRGQIVLAIDLRHRLGLGNRAADKAPTNIVTRIGDGLLCFVVDELFDVMTLSNNQFEQIPDTLSAREKEFVTGCFKLQERLLIMLDAYQIADISATIRDTLEHDGIQRNSRVHATALN